MTTRYRDEIRVRSDGIYIRKRMHEELDYPIDYSPWLAKQGPDGDVIASSIWEFPEGITVISTDQGETTTSCWIAGGTPGHSYKIVNRIVTYPGGREAEQVFFIEIESN